MSTNTTNNEGKKVTYVTLLKFVKSDVNDALISYVSTNPVTGQVKGVRVDSKYPHKIVLCSAQIAPYIISNVLYKSTIIPMKSGAGYVCIAAEPVQFKADIKTVYVPKTTYQIIVTFGNKAMVFDPYKGKKASVLCANEFIDTIQHRLDISNVDRVVALFNLMSDELLKTMKKDGVVVRI